MARGHIRKRGKGNAWSLVIPVPDPDTGKTKQRWFTVHGTKRDAERELARLLTEADAGRLTTHSKLTVAQFLDRWLSDHVKPGFTPRTYERYEATVRLWIVPHLGSLQLERVRTIDVIGWQAKVRAGSGRYGKPLSPESLRSYFATLHVAFETAVKWRLLSANPCDHLAMPHIPPRQMHALFPDQARAFLQATAAEGVYWQALFTLAITSGMRFGEIRALRWCDVDLRKKTLSVVRTAQRITGMRVHVGAPKTAGSRRSITLGDEVVQLLKKQKAAQNATRLAAATWTDEDLVFANDSGYFIDEKTVRSTFRRVLAACDLPQIRFHDLRHTAATLLLTAGVHPKVVSERLGHSTVAITLQRYSHVSETLQVAAAQTLDDMLANH